MNDTGSTGVIIERSLGAVCGEWLKFQYTGAGLSVTRRNLTSLAGSPKIIGGGLYVDNNLLASLKDVHNHITEIKGEFCALDNPIKSHVLGLLLIKGVTEVRLDKTEVQDILNRHLGKGRAGMLMAQEELIEAGFEKFAQL